MNSIVEVPFYAESVQTVREGDSVWVVVKRVCEALGIAEQRQAAKLKAKPWATTTLVVAVAEDGKNREVFCLDLESLPMWLATIDANKVAPEARFKLVAYQKECARVLRDHFFGRRAEPAGGVPSELGAILVNFNAQLTDLRQQVSDLANRSTVTITRSEANLLRGRIQRAGELQARFEGGTGKARAQSIRMEVMGLAGWSGSGCRYENMPRDKHAMADRAISLVEKRLLERNPPPGDTRQLSLIKSG
jgi:hypothetical protein